MEPSFFTINACNRCRKRKARCDTGLPACGHCQSHGSVCEYTDPRSKETFARSHIQELEEQVSQLEAELQKLNGAGDSKPAGPVVPDANKPEELPRSDLIRLGTGGDAHFLGGSSGMSLARLVLESTRHNAKLNGIDLNAQRNKARRKSTTSFGRSPESTQAVGDSLPSQDAAASLIDFFFSQYQVQYPILSEGDFMKDVADLYVLVESGQYGHDDPRTTFMVKIVLAISLQLLSEDDTESLDLAEGFRSSALRQLGVVLQTKSAKTLQCLLLLLLSSLVNSRSAPMWYISGLCMRMCVDLGYHLERTIQHESAESDRDNMRRLFWVAYTFDRSLATMLGRPFFLGDDKIDVRFPTTSIPSSKIPHVHHWLEMQRIQSEIVHTIHATKTAASKSEKGPESFLQWQARVTERLAKWDEASPKLADSAEHNMDWWRYLFHNAMLLLHRPSSNGLLASSQSPQMAYASARDILHLSFVRAHKNLSEFTWLDLHGQIISGLTLLFLVLKNPDARAKAQNDWVSFKSCLVEWQVVLEKLCQRWEQMARTNNLLAILADETMDMVDKPEARANRSHRGRLSARDRYYRATQIKGLGTSIQQPANMSSGQPNRHQFDDRAGMGQVEMPLNGDGQQPALADGNQTYEEQSAAYQANMPLNGVPNGVPSMESSSDQQMDFTPEHPELWWHPDNIDLSLLLTADTSLGFGQYDVVSQQDVGSLDNVPMFLGQMKSYGVPVNSVIGAIDTALTDSVLNFHDLEDGA